MNHNKNAIAVAIAATLGGSGTAADAADHAVVLTSIVTYSNGGSSGANLTSSTATFSYDDVTNLLTQTGGIFASRWSIVPTVTLFRHTITGLVMGNGGAASASSYICTNGNFGTDISFANLCGNYNFGANFIDDSTISYGPGTAFARTIGGDDMLAGDTIQQSINQLDGMTSAGIVASSLRLSNVTADPFFRGYEWNFTLATDLDGDGIENSQDNCTLAANPGQCDSDGDGFGNHCDGDLNNNGATNAFDTPLLRQQLGLPSVGPTYNQADLNCDGSVNAFDTPLFRSLLGAPPGPSGLVP